MKIIEERGLLSFRVEGLVMHWLLIGLSYAKQVVRPAIAIGSTCMCQVELVPCTTFRPMWLKESSSERRIKSSFLMPEGMRAQ
jgi:hypothetical protein